MPSTQECPTASAISYQRLMIHFAPTNISQTAAVATVSTMMAASKAIEEKGPIGDIGPDQFLRPIACHFLLTVRSRKC
jgi:hypothetical protein